MIGRIEEPRAIVTIESRRSPADSLYSGTQTGRRSSGCKDRHGTDQRSAARFLFLFFEALVFGVRDFRSGTGGISMPYCFQYIK